MPKSRDYINPSVFILFAFKVIRDARDLNPPDSLKLAQQKKSVYRVYLAKYSTGGAWGLVYVLCLALLVHDLDPKNVKAFGLVMGANGFGNLLATLYFASRDRLPPEQLVYIGLTWLVFFFSLMAIPMSFSIFLVRHSFH